MAAYVEGGGGAFDQLMFAPPRQNVLNFLQESLYEATPLLTDSSRNFFTEARNMWSNYFGETAAMIQRAAVRAVESLWNANVIRELTELEQFQTAPPVMIRYLMANPEVRQMYQQQKVDGYSEEYVDLDPGTVGEQHYDYRRVMNGIVQFDEDGEGWSAATFFEDLMPNDEELYLDQQTDIIGSWGHLSRLLRRGSQDPVSRWGSAL